MHAADASVHAAATSRPIEDQRQLGRPTAGTGEHGAASAACSPSMHDGIGTHLRACLPAQHASAIDAHPTASRSCRRTPVEACRVCCFGLVPSRSSDARRQPTPYMCLIFPSVNWTHDITILKERTPDDRGGCSGAPAHARMRWHAHVSASKEQDGTPPGWAHHDRAGSAGAALTSCRSVQSVVAEDDCDGMCASIWQAPQTPGRSGGAAGATQLRMCRSVVEAAGSSGCAVGRHGFHGLFQKFLEAQVGSAAEALGDMDPGNLTATCMPHGAGHGSSECSRGSGTDPAWTAL